MYVFQEMNFSGSFFGENKPGLDLLVLIQTTVTNLESLETFKAGATNMWTLRAKLLLYKWSLT